MKTFKSYQVPNLNFKEAIKKPIKIKCVQILEPFEVETLEGKMTGQKNDWLMIGINGELYPCANDVFQKTYTLCE